MATAGQLSPEFIATIVREANELNDDCRFEEADARFEEAIRVAPVDRLVSAYVVAAHNRGDWRSTIERAAAARISHPNMMTGFRLAFAGLFELERFSEAMELTRLAEAKFPDQSWPLEQAARIAEEQQEYDRAEGVWAGLRERFPASAQGWLGAAQMRSRIGRSDSALQIMEEAAARFPADPIVQAWLIRCLLARRRFEAAEECSDKACRDSPDRFDLAQLRADIPVMRHPPDGDEAVERYERLIARFPSELAAATNYVDLLTRAGRFAEAEQALAQAISRLSSTPALGALRICEAMLKREMSDAASAESICREVIEQFPNRMPAYIELAGLLNEVGKLDQAIEICERAIARFRFRLAPFAAKAKVLAARGDVRGALETWRIGAEKCPRDPRVKQQLYLTRMLIAEKVDEQSLDVLDEGVGAEREAGALSNVMMRFESLSGSSNGGCEFGLVQRRFGAEPIGLLRWGGIEFEDLMRMLSERLVGVGAVSQTRFGQGLGGAHVVQDTIYNLEIHTFNSTRELAENDSLSGWCARLAFLARKLLRDLELGQKIFVYATASALERRHLDRAAEVMAKFPLSNLLLIQEANASHMAHSVVRAAPGVFLGFVEALRWDRAEETHMPVRFASWGMVMLEAASLLERGRGVRFDAK